MNRKEKEQIVDLIKTLLRTRKGSVYTGMTASQYFRDRWGIDVDYHIFSEVMDEWSRIGLASVESEGGFTKYMIE